VLIAPALTEREIVARVRIATVSEAADDETAALLPWVYVGVIWPDGSRWVAPVNMKGEIERADLLYAYRRGRQVFNQVVLAHLEPAGRA
jgi:hypothetical protein